MALPPIYGGGAVPQVQRLPNANPGAYGVGLARDVEGVAAAVRGADRARQDNAERIAEIEHRSALLDRERERGRMLADAAVGSVELQSRLSAWEDETFQNMPSGGAGVEDAHRAFVEKETDAYLSGITDPEVRQQMLRTVAEIRVSSTGRVRDATIRARAAKVKSNADLMRDLLHNSYRRDPTQSMETAFDQIDALVSSHPMPEDQAALVTRVLRQSPIIGRVEGMVDQGQFEPALELLRGGSLDSYLAPEQIEQLTGKVESAQNRALALAQSAEKAALEEFRSSARLDIERVNDGVRVDVGELQVMADKAAALGEEALTYDLQTALAKARVTDSYSGKTPAEMEEAQRQIEQSGNWREDETLVAAHGQLGVLIQATRARANSDKLSLWSENGGTLGAFNLTDPAAMRARFAQGDAAAKRYGGPPQYMTEAEAAPLRDQWNKGGPSDRIALIETVSAYGNSRAKALLRQLAPNQPQFAVLADLATLRNAPAGRQLVREAVNGWEQIKANGKLIDGASMQREVDTQFGSALAMMDGIAKQGIMQVAQGIYANRAAQGNINKFDRDLWKESYQAALGKVGDGTGGIGEARSVPTVLPRGMTQSDFDTILARADGNAIIEAAGRDAPIWGGKTMNIGEFKALIPVMRADGIYMFRTKSGGYVRSQRVPSQNFILDIRALAGVIRQRPPQAAAPSDNQKPPPVRSAYEALPIKPRTGPASPYEAPR